MKTPKRGDRVRLIRCNDPYTRLQTGELGTVGSVDSMGTVHVSWDSGAQLGLVADAGDRWEVFEEPHGGGQGTGRRVTG